MVFRRLSAALFSENMKYFVGLILSLLLAVPMGPIEASVITNNMSNSTITQNFYLNCTTEQCQPVIQEIVVSDPVPVIEEAIEAEESEDINDQPTSDVVNNGIRINEIVSAPLSGEKEWVELYNSLEVAVDLEGWFLEEGAGKTTTLFGEIASGGYLVFETSNLNNSGDIIFLKNSAGEIVDQAIYGNWEDNDQVENPVSPKSGESLIFWEEKYVVSTETTPSQPNLFPIIEEEVEEENLEESEPQVEVSVLDVDVVVSDPVETQNFASTSLEEDVLNVNYQYSEEIQINEFLPDPDGSDKNEWIELYNNSEEDVVLDGWSLDDIEDGGSSVYSLTGKTIKAKGYLSLTQEETGIVLNNTSDEINLKDPDGKVVSQVVYVNTKTDESYVLIENEWQQSEELTPGEENVMKEVVEVVAESEDVAEELLEVPLYSSYSLNQIRDLSLRQKVLIQGRVVVLPGVFSRNVIYINDGLSGLQVYFSSADWPELEVGQELMISGSVSQSLGEKRVLVKEKVDIVTLGEVETVNSSEISAVEIDLPLVGSFISLEGKLIEKENSRLLMADDNGEFLVYLKKGAEISSSLYEVDDQLRISGIIVQNKEEFRLQPRSEDDIQKIDKDDEVVMGAVASDAALLGTDSTRRKITIGLALSALFLFVLQVGLVVSKKLSKRALKRPFYRLKEYLQGVKG